MQLDGMKLLSLGLAYLQNKINGPPIIPELISL